MNNYSSINHQEIFEQCKTGEIKFLYLLGVDEKIFDNYKETFVLYQGHHGDAGAHIANVILPGSAYTEKNCSFVNLEGRLQNLERAVFSPGDSREDWTIIRALSESIGRKVKFDSLNELKSQMFKEVFADKVFFDDKYNDKPLKGKFKYLKSSKLNSTGRNQYMTCPISRSSNTMAECIKSQVS